MAKAHADAHMHRQPENKVPSVANLQLRHKTSYTSYYVETNLIIE